MKRAKFALVGPIVCATLTLCGGEAFAQIYRCFGDNGQVTLQQAPCLVPAVRPPASTSRSGVQAAGGADSSQRELDAVLREQMNRCSKLSMESYEYASCAAKLTCMEDGAIDATFRECVDRRTRAKRHEIDVLTAQRKAADVEKAALTRPGLAHSSLVPAGDVVDCWRLSKFAEAKGHGFFERLLIVDEARKQGKCQ